MDENERIRREVEKKKQRAEELNLPTLITDLYMEHIKYFPSWINNNREYVPIIVKSCTESQNEEKEEIILELNNKKYCFCFKESNFSTPDGEYYTHGNLELFCGNEKCFSLSMACDYDNYGATWRPFGINAFKEKEWIKDFQELKKQIENDEKLREEKEKNNPDKINKLKEDFDIN